MDHIFSIAQLEGKLELYKDGLISDPEFRDYCAQVGVSMPTPRRNPPSPLTQLRHEAKFQRKRIAKAKRLLALREKVARMMLQADDLEFQNQKERGIVGRDF